MKRAGGGKLIARKEPSEKGESKKSKESSEREAETCLRREEAQQQAMQPSSRIRDRPRTELF